MTTKDKGYTLDKFYAKIHRRYDLINKLFTFGLDKKWRKITVEECLKDNPRNILDLCCGTGDVAIATAKKAGANSNVIGYDMSGPMLSVAREKSKYFKELNVEFKQGDAGNMPFVDASFDRITIGFGFRNLTFENPQREKHIAEIYRVLAPGGSLLILESSTPSNILVRFFYKVHLYAILIPIGGLLTGDFKAYWYLAHSSAKFYSSAELKAMLSLTGFKSFSIQRFLFGAANLIVARK